MEIMSFWHKNNEEEKYEITKSNTYYNVIILIGIVLSFLWIVFIDAKPFSDFDYYYTLAVNIANGGLWGNTYTSVGYSIILGGIFKLFGASIFKAKVFNICITLVNYLCFKAILSKINLKEKDRKIIFTIFVLFPNNIFYNNILGTELLFTAILFIITYIYFSNIKYKYFFIGILTGLNTIIKPFFIIVFFALFLVDLIKHKKFLKAVLNSLTVIIISIIVISPWVYRNTKLIGQFTYVSNNGGIVLYINNNSQNHSGRWMAASKVENSIVNTEEYKKANRTEQNKMLSDAAKKWIRNHPMQFIELGFKRLYNTYFWGDDVLYSTYNSGVSAYYNNILFKVTNNIRIVIFLPAILYILIYSLKTLIYIFQGKSHLLHKFTIYSVVIFFMFTSVYFIMEGQGRYSFPEIFIMIYCFYFFFKNLFEAVRR